MNRPARVWITRARPGAERTADRVAALGFGPVVAPLLTVETIPQPAPDLSDVGALAFTSVNGVTAFATLTPERARPVFTVGDTSARAARVAGFTDVASAGGDVGDLARLIAARPLAGPVLWAGAEQPAGDLIGDLARNGVTARGIAVYRTTETDVDAALFAVGRVGAILLHSPRAAARLAGRLGAADGLVALCLSPAVASALGPTPCAVRIAARPDEDSLLALLGKPQPRV